MIEPTQELFMWLKNNLPYKVYDGINTENIYPSVHLSSENNSIDYNYKNYVYGSVSQSIRVLCEPTKRGTLSNILIDIKRTLRKLTHTKNYQWILSDVNQQILQENTAKPPLLMGVLTFKFIFY